MSIFAGVIFALLGVRVTKNWTYMRVTPNELMLGS
jgi:hypothetical protein